MMKAWKKGAIIGFLIVPILLPIGLIFQDAGRILVLALFLPLYLLGWRGAGVDIPIITPTLALISWTLIGAITGYLYDKRGGSVLAE